MAVKIFCHEVGLDDDANEAQMAVRIRALYRETVRLGAELDDARRRLNEGRGRFGGRMVTDHDAAPAHRLAERRMVEGGAGAALGRLMAEGYSLPEACLLQPQLKQRLMSEELPSPESFPLVADWVNLKAMQMTAPGSGLTLSEARRLLLQDRDLYEKLRKEETHSARNPVGMRAARILAERARKARERAGGSRPDDGDDDD